MNRSERTCNILHWLCWRWHRQLLHPVCALLTNEIILSQWFLELARPSRFIQAFLDFLHCANDEANLRVLFERVLKVLPATQAKEVWNRFMTFEGAFGSDSAMMVCSRKAFTTAAAETFSYLLRRLQVATETRWAASKHLDPRRAQLPCLLHRYRFGNMWPCSGPEVRCSFHLLPPRCLAYHFS